MENSNNPTNRTEIDPEKVTNQPEKIVNDEIPREHEPTNEEQWAHDVNEEFGDDFILPEQDEEEKATDL